MKTIRNFIRLMENMDDNIVKTPKDISQNAIDVARKEKPEIYGGLDDDDIRMKLYRADKDLLYMTKLNIEASKKFVLDNNTKYLILDTELPVKPEILALARLPFKAIYLDVEFQKDEIGLDENDTGSFGMLLTESFDAVPNIDKETKEVKIDYNHYLYVVMGINGRRDNRVGSGLERYKIPISLSDDSIILYTNNTVQDNIRKFIINLLLLINQPEIEFVEAERRRGNPKARDKRRAIDIPEHTFIKLTGRLKVYAEKARERENDASYGYRFKVRGHWRHYKSDRYKSLKGTVKWIEGFEKGTGILIEKEYMIRKEEDDTITYDDIKPLKKPLSKTRR